MSYFIYTDLISSLLDPRLVDPGGLLKIPKHCCRQSSAISCPRDFSQKQCSDRLPILHSD